MSKVLMISSDCHAGALPATYAEYMPREFHAPAKAWWVAFAREMMNRAGTFFDQEAVEAYAEEGGSRGMLSVQADADRERSDDDFYAMLSDETSPFAPRRGEFDADARIQDLDGDGVAAEVIFPQMVPFGGGLTQYRRDVSPAHNLEGLRAYNRWLGDLCKRHPGRHAGIALINVDDIDVTVKEIHAARDLGVTGGVLLPTSTGDHPFYHHPRYEPLWSVCEELEMPLHTHSGWSPDYGDVPSATAMYITEVDMWAHRTFAPLVWSGAFERHPGLELVYTEAGCTWILETLRRMEFKADNPIFKHFTKGLSLRPSEYFQRQCYLGASFLPAHEGRNRHEIGIDKYMYGTDYPHLEGTWPNTGDALSETFAGYPEDELRAILGENAARLYGFDLEALQPIVDRIGRSLESIQGGA